MKTVFVTAFLFLLVLPSSTLGATFKGVQKGSITLSAKSTTVTIGAVDKSKSFLVFTVTTDNDATGNYQLSGEITNSTTLTFERYNNSAVVSYIEWQVFEFTDGVNVQHGNAGFSGVTDVAISSVDLTKSFVLLSGYKDGSTFGDDDGVTARLTTPTNLRLAVYNGTYSNASYQVVEYDSCVVQQISATLSAGSATGSVAITAVDMTKTLLITNNQYSGNANADDMPRAELANSTSVNFSREGTATNVIIHGFVIEFTDETLVAAYTQDFTSGTTTVAVEIGNAPQDRSGVIGCGHLGRQGSTTHSSDDNTGYNWFTFNLSNDRLVTVTRAVGGSATAVATFQTVTFRKYEGQEIWLEDFNDLADGTTSDAGATAWTLPVPGSPNGQGYVEVISQEFGLRKAGGNVTWASEWIDISSHSGVKITADLRSTGAGWGEYLNIYYVLDNGAEIALNNGLQNQDFGSAVASLCEGLDGDSLQVVIKSYLTGNNAYYYFDNIRVYSEPSDPPLSSTIYAIADGDWTSTATWSASPGGASCGCTPSATSDVRIGCGYTVNMNGDGSANNVTIYEGSALVWTASDAELNIYNGGKVHVLEGGYMDRNGYNGKLEFEDATYTTLQVDDPTTGLNIEQIQVLGGGVLTISGSGVIATSAQLRSHAGSTVNNNFDGNFTVGGNVVLSGSGSRFNNYTSLDVGNRVNFNSTGATLKNYGTLNVTNDIRNSDNTKTDNGFVNAAGAVVNVTNNIDANDAPRFTFENYGTANIGGSLLNGLNTGGDYSNIYNYENAVLNLAQSNSTLNWKLYCNYGGNTVVYGRAGNESLFIPEDSYWSLTLSGSGTKALSGMLDVDGELVISGSAILDFNGYDLFIGGDWTNTSSDSDPVVEGTRTITFDGSADQTFSNTNGGAFYNVIMNKPAGQVIMSDSMRVSNSITFTQGIVQATASAPLILTNTATVSGASDASHVDGPVRKIGNGGFSLAPDGFYYFEMPVGDNGHFSPISYTQPDSSTAIFEASYIHDNPRLIYDGSALEPSLDRVSSCEYWMFDNIGDTATVYVTLSWDDVVSCGVEDPSALRVAHWNGSMWVDEGQVWIDETAKQIAAGPLSSFSPFTLGSTNSGNPLPIKLIDFEVTAKVDHVQLEWTTASERNNDFYTIERRSNGKDFEEIGVVKSKGEGNGFLSYDFRDRQPLSGVSYYRLKQTDLDGQYEYVGTRSVEYQSDFGFSMYPNPATGGTVHVTLTDFEYEGAELLVFNVLGELAIRIPNIDQHDKIQLQDKFDKGVYILQLRHNGQQLIQEKLIVQ